MMRDETVDAILESCRKAEGLLPASQLEGHYAEDLSGYIRIFRKVATQRLQKSDLPNIERAIRNTFQFASTDHARIMACYPVSQQAFWELMPAANRICAAEINI